MIRRPPRSTLFPYTNALPISAPAQAAAAHGCRSCAIRGRSAGRSEEHTSELQSHLNLVCRLLLEKKKKENANPVRPHTLEVSLLHSVPSDPHHRSLRHKPITL